MVLTAPDYTVGWISALPDELAAAEGMLDEEHESLDAQIQDTNSYSYGKIGSHNVVIACLPSGTVGTTAAATVATNMTRTFPNLRFGLIVGVGGGIPHLEAGPENDIRLGDVVVSTPQGGYGGVIQYDYGKTIQHKEFKHTGSLNQPPAILSTAITRLRGRARRRGYGFSAYIKKMLEENPTMEEIFSSPGSENDSLFDANCLHSANESDCSTCQGTLLRRSRRDPKVSVVHYGLIGSANQVVRDANIRDKIGKQMGVLCLEMEAGGLMNGFPCIVIRGISDYCDTHKNKIWQPFAATVAAAYTKELLEHISLPQVGDMPKAADFMVELVNHTVILEKATSKLNTLQKNIDFGTLPCAEGAGFNWASGSADNRCHPSTRIDLLDQIHKWFEDSKSESIYWLNGMAGTGKTTIAREICYRFTQNDELAASFFFKKGEGDRGNAVKFCSTIAIQLVQSLKGFDIILAEVLQRSRDAIRLSFQEQFQKLIEQPLSKIKQSQKALIVIDALDECADDQDVKRLLILFSKLNGYTKLRLKIFVTGRPELYVRLGFAHIKTEHVTFKLHTIDQAVIEHDIETYMTTELARIREEHNLDPVGGQSLPKQWPDSKRLNGLLKLATPLFIYAATICRFIGSNNLSDPEGKLERMLISRQSHGLESIYLPVLEQLLQDCDASERLLQVEEFNAIIGPLVILFEPLTTSTFAKLLDLEIRRIEILLHSLHSVLMVPDNIDTPVHLLHLSFRDFLVDPKRKNYEFVINEPMVHATLMERCLIFLKTSNFLKQNICELEHPGSHRSEASTDILHRCLPPEVQYACIYWLQHLEARQNCPFDTGMILSFLKEHFLHWLEILSLLGRVTEVATTLKRITQMAHLSANEQLYRFLEDAERFLSMFGSIISEYPLQLYSSALVFAPELSAVRMNFQQYLPSYFVPISTIRKEWTVEHLVIGAHTGEITSVAFSADNYYLATAGSKYQESIKIWDMSLGFNSATMNVDIDMWLHAPRAMAFSPDGSIIACGFYNALQLYDAASGTPLITIKAQYKVNSIAFSNNGELVGFAVERGPGPLLNTWCCRSGDLFRNYLGVAQRIDHLAFSRQDKILIVGGKSGISLWDVAQATQIKFFDVFMMTMATALISNTLFVVIQSGPEIQTYGLDTVSQSMQKLSISSSNAIPWREKTAISPTGEYLASSGLIPGVVELWSTSTVTQIVSFRPHTTRIKTLHFSSSDYLVTGALEGIAKVWKISDLPAMATKSLVDKISMATPTLSGDGKRCAWLYQEGMGVYIQIWDIQKARLVVNARVETKLNDEPLVIDQFELSHCGTILAQRTSGHLVRLWKVSSKLEAYSPRFRGAGFFTFSPADHIIAFSEYDNTELKDSGSVQVWDLLACSCIGKWDVLDKKIETMGFSPKCQYLAWCAGNTVKIVNLYPSKLIGLPIAFYEDNKPIILQAGFPGTSLAFHEDGEHIVILEGSRLHLFSILSGQKLEVIDIRKSWTFLRSRPKNSMLFDPSGESLQTDFGVFTFQRLKPLYRLSPHLRTETMWIEEEWIKIGDKKFLWIPASYRSSTWVSAGRSLVLLAPDNTLYILNIDTGIGQGKHGTQEASNSFDIEYGAVTAMNGGDSNTQVIDLAKVTLSKRLSLRSSSSRQAKNWFEKSFDSRFL